MQSPSCPQAESLWLHLPIITELAAMCHRVFEGGSVQYAYTTIPTYPRWARVFSPLGVFLHHDPRAAQWSVVTRASQSSCLWEDTTT